MKNGRARANFFKDASSTAQTFFQTEYFAKRLPNSSASSAAQISVLYSYQARFCGNHISMRTMMLLA
jgi:hypothetical protein